MKRTLLLLATLLQHARAEELLIGDPTWGARISLPQAWESDNYMGTWYQGWTVDRNVWLSAITFKEMPPNWQRKWLPKHCDTFGVNIVVPEGEIASTAKRFGKFKADEFRISALSEGKPIEVTVMLVKLAPTRILLITVGGRTADRLLHKDTINQILESVRVAPVEAVDNSKAVGK